MATPHLMMGGGGLGMGTPIEYSPGNKGWLISNVNYLNKSRLSLPPICVHMFETNWVISNPTPYNIIHRCFSLYSIGVLVIFLILV